MYKYFFILVIWLCSILCFPGFYFLFDIQQVAFVFSYIRTHSKMFALILVYVYKFIALLVLFHIFSIWCDISSRDHIYASGSNRLSRSGFTMEIIINIVCIPIFISINICIQVWAYKHINGCVNKRIITNRLFLFFLLM